MSATETAPRGQQSDPVNEIVARIGRGEFDREELLRINDAAVTKIRSDRQAANDAEWYAIWDRLGPGVVVGVRPDAKIRESQEWMKGKRLGKVVRKLRNRVLVKIEGDGFLAIDWVDGTEVRFPATLLEVLDA